MIESAYVTALQTHRKVEKDFEISMVQVVKWLSNLQPYQDNKSQKPPQIKKLIASFFAAMEINSFTLYKREEFREISRVTQRVSAAGLIAQVVHADVGKHYSVMASSIIAEKRTATLHCSTLPFLISQHAAWRYMERAALPLETLFCKKLLINLLLYQVLSCANHVAKLRLPGIAIPFENHLLLGCEIEGGFQTDFYEYGRNSKHGDFALGHTSYLVKTFVSNDTLRPDQDVLVARLNSFVEEHIDSLGLILELVYFQGVGMRGKMAQECLKTGEVNKLTAGFTDINSISKSLLIPLIDAALPIVRSSEWARSCSTV